MALDIKDNETSLYKLGKETGKQIGEEIGKEERTVEVAVQLLRMGMSHEFVAQATGLSLLQVELLAKQMDGQ